jgi:hypothetical protein
MAKLLRAEGLVYAFEPCPDNFLQLQKKCDSQQPGGCKSDTDKEGRRIAERVLGSGYKVEPAGSRHVYAE